MNSREAKDRTLYSSSPENGNLESPFLEEELFIEGSEAEWEAHLATLETESPFVSAFEQGRTSLIEPEELEVEFVEEEEWAEVDDFPEEEAEAYDEEAFSDLEEDQKEIYYKDEAEYEEAEAGEEKVLARMKFEFQTRNRIWRYDTKTKTEPTLLPRKYGTYDFLVNAKSEGVRLESETGGVLEFETEWFRRWKNLKKAIEKAIEMTRKIDSAPEEELPIDGNLQRLKKFPFDVSHLRTWKLIEKKEGKSEQPLEKDEELYVEIIHDKLKSGIKWKAAIQSSESFLLEYYESFLRQHEKKDLSDDTIKRAQEIQDAANTDGIPATELVKLRSFLQIIVNYIIRGRRVDVKGKPAKFAFWLMSRTNFASMYEELLTDKEKKLFTDIVKEHVILKKLKLKQETRFFKEGYGREEHKDGPTVHNWLQGILIGKDLLRGLSGAMGRYTVQTKKYDKKTKKRMKDQWLVKFETRNTIMGRMKEAKDWVDYASKLFERASKREEDAIRLAYQQGITDENKLTNFVFHARHPNLGGRRIRKGERALAQKWLWIRNDVVRPSLQGVQPELEEFVLEESGEWSGAEDFPTGEAEVYSEEAPEELEDGIMELSNEETEELEAEKIDESLSEEYDQKIDEEMEEEEEKAVDRTATEAWAIASLASAGFIAGYSVFALVNRDTGREHQLHIPTGGLTAGITAGGGQPSYTMFKTSRPVRFADFDGIGARLTSANIGLFFGKSIAYLTLWDGPAYVSPQLAYVKMGGWGAMLPGGSVAHGVTQIAYGSGTRSGTVPLRLVLPPKDIPSDPRLVRIRMAAKESRKVNIPNELLFDFDKYELKPEARRSLLYIADLLNNRRKLPVTIEGHTDSKGSNQYNMELSRKRALAVKQWFIEHKVYKAAEFRVAPYGESRPIALNQKPDGSDNPEGRRKNRRVVIRAYWNL